MKYYNVAKRYGAKVSARNLGTGAAITATLLPLMQAAHAEVPAEVATTLTGMSADFTSIFGSAFAVLATIVSAMLAWRYFKKLGNKV